MNKQPNKTVNTSFLLWIIPIIMVIIVGLATTQLTAHFSKTSSAGNSTIGYNTYILQKGLGMTGGSFWFSPSRSIADSNNERLYLISTPKIIVINTESGVIEHEIENDFNPVAITISSDGASLYVYYVKYENGVLTKQLSIINTTTYDSTSSQLDSEKDVIDFLEGPHNRLYFLTSAGNIEQIEVFDLNTDSFVGSIPVSVSYDNGQQFTIVDSTLYLLSPDDDSFTRLFKFDITNNTPQEIQSIPLNYYSNHLSVAPDHSSLAILSKPGEIFQYNPTTFAQTKTYTAEEFTYVEYSFDGQRLIGFHNVKSNSSSGGIQEYDVNSGTLLGWHLDSELSVFENGLVLHNDKIALLYRDEARIFKPTTFSAAIPVITKDYCIRPYYDDFSDPTSGWVTGQTSSTLYEYLNGEYRIKLIEANRWTGVTRNHVLDNMETMSIEGRLANDNHGYWGLLFGISHDWSSFYAFEISPRFQSWQILHFDQQTGWSLVKNQYLQELINNGSKVNELRMTKNGPGLAPIRFFINGTEVTDMNLPNPGRVGISVGSIDRNVDARFDNYIFADNYCPITVDVNNFSTFDSANVFIDSSQRHEFWLNTSD